ncbi:MAG: hypothetical protein NZ455_01770 [Bacteroidia bacterium]|nr:hypothetical protein [Bacteroidia bacterium]MDW8347022.1 hypothetical protein [Bacteroidia bacterium]
MTEPLRLIIIGLCICIGFISIAQNQYSTDADKFIEEYARSLSSTNQATAKEHAEAFKTMWINNTLDANQKTKTIEIINAMRKKRLVPLQVMLLTQTLMHLTQGQRLISLPVDELLNISQKVVENAQNSSEILRFMTNAESLIRTGMLYKAGNNGWYGELQNTKLFYKEGDTTATETNPIPAGPYLQFSAPKITYSNRRDSMIIYEPQGILNLSTQTYYGTKGKMTWERHGSQWKEVYVDLGKYKINLKEGFVQDDTVTFYYPNYLTKSVKGGFKDVPSGTFGKNANYPMFVSHDMDIEITGLADNIKYKGGFTLQGVTKIGSGNGEKDAIMTIKKSGNNYVKIGTQSVLLDSTVYIARPASVTIVAGKDSIYHPALDFKYDTRVKYLTLLRNLNRGGDNRARVPIFDSYHKLEYEFDIIEWYLDSSLIRFNNILDRANNKAVIRSADYFSRNEFLKLQSIFPVNIVAWLVKYHKENPEVPMILEDITDEMNGGKNADKKSNTKTGLGVRPVQVEAVVIEAEAQGYLRYNRQTHEIKLLPKANDAMLALAKFQNAYNKNREKSEKGFKAPPPKPDKDYDQIQMLSAIGTVVVKDTTKHLKLLNQLRDYQSVLIEERDLYKREMGTKKFENQRKKELEEKQNEVKRLQELASQTKSEAVRKNYEKDIAILQKEIENLQNPTPPDTVIRVKKFTKFANIPAEEVYPLLNKLEYDSLATYDPKTDIVDITKKGIKRLDSVTTAQDTIQKTQAEKIKERNKKKIPNAELDLNTMQLTLNGIEPFYMGDSVSVRVLPKNGVVKVDKNRRMTFDGIIQAGKLDFFGEKFTFSYDSFLVNLNNAKMKFMLPDVDAKGNPIRDNNGRMTYRPLKTELSEVKGKLYISEPNNKNGLAVNPVYPIVDANTKSKIYYDDKEIQGGAYSKDKMYFELNPFVIDSVETFNENTMNLGGRFVSNIFPTFNQTIRINKDRTLGFKHHTDSTDVKDFKGSPKKGLQMYGDPNKNAGGKANYVGEITLDQKGLRGSGEIEYLSTKGKSKDFVFFHDKTISSNFEMLTQPGMPQFKAQEFPLVKGINLELNWRVPQDSFIAVAKANPLEIYPNAYGKLKGEGIITPRGMVGNGILEVENGELRSSNYNFREFRFTANPADFSVLTSDKKNRYFFSKRNKFEFDVKARIANFDALEEGKANSEYPFNLFKSSLKTGVWDLNTRTITMEAPKGDDINKYYFFSTKKSHDSLNFKSIRSVYRIDQGKLYTYGVPYILSADSKIIPNEADSSKVVIAEGGNIEPLSEAHIDMSMAKTRRYHAFEHATVKLNGRTDFDAVGQTYYVDATKDSSVVYFNKIEAADDEDFLKAKAESKGKKKSETEKDEDRVKIDPINERWTQGFAKVPEEKPIILGPNIEYKGNIKMISKRPYWTLDGQVRVKLAGNKYTSWFNYSGETNPDTLLIPVKDPKDEKGKILAVGLFNNDSIGLYTRFLDPKIKQEDADLLVVSGELSYNAATQDFRIGPKATLTGQSLEGNLINYKNAEKPIASVQGVFNMPLKVDREGMNKFAWKVTGIMKNNVPDNYFEFRILTGLTIPTLAKSWDLMGVKFKEGTAGSQEVDYSKNNFNITHANYLTDKKSKPIMEKVAEETDPYDKDIKIPGDIVFSDLKLIYEHKYRSFRSSGLIGIAKIGNVNINKYVKGYVEICKGRDTDTITVSLEPSEGNHFFFAYTEGTVRYSSSYEDFNAMIAKASPVRKGKIKAGTLIYDVAEDDFERKEFDKRFVKRYILTEEDTPKKEKKELNPDDKEQKQDKPENKQEIPDEKKQDKTEEKPEEKKTDKLNEKKPSGNIDKILEGIPEDKKDKKGKKKKKKDETPDEE